MKMIISSSFLIFISLIHLIPSFSIHQAPSCNGGASLCSAARGIKPDIIVNDTSDLHDTISSKATNILSLRTSTKLRLPKGQTTGHLRPHLRNVHGILNVIEWGTLLPTGAIVARIFRKPPLECDQWYNVHSSCQAAGYVLGASGLAIGLWLGNSSKNLQNTWESGYHYFHIFYSTAKDGRGIQKVLGNVPSACRICVDCDDRNKHIPRDS